MNVDAVEDYEHRARFSVVKTLCSDYKLQGVRPGLTEVVSSHGDSL